MKRASYAGLGIRGSGRPAGCAAYHGRVWTRNVGEFIPHLRWRPAGLRTGVMIEAERSAADPFDQLRARWLLVLAAGCFALVYGLLYASGRLGVAAEPADLLAFLFVAYVATGALLLGAAKRLGLDLGRLVGRTPTRREIVAAAGCSIPLLFVALGSAVLIYGVVVFALGRGTAPPMAWFSGLPQLEGGSLLSKFGLALIVWLLVVVPLVEEFLFRGLLLHRWARKWSPRAALLVQAVVFGLLHWNLVFASVFGYVMGVLYLRTQKLLVPVVAHAAVNALGLAAGALIRALAPSDGLRGNPALVVVGLSFLAVAAAWVVTFLHNNRPGSAWRLPHGAQRNV